jgi:hypothetical protein
VNPNVACVFVNVPCFVTALPVGATVNDNISSSTSTVIPDFANKSVTGSLNVVLLNAVPVIVPVGV